MLLLPGVVLPGVVVVLGWPPPGALAAFGPMPPAVAAEVPDADALPAGPPVVPVCDGFVVSGAGAVLPPEVPLVLMLPVVDVLLLVLLVLLLLPLRLGVLAASPPVVLAVELLPAVVSAARWSLRWQATRALAAISAMVTRPEEVNRMGNSLLR